jgi:uncharacterized protein YdeI (YjbR/CyaY-like superfamily)
MNHLSPLSYYPKSRAEWRKWLEKNHRSRQSVWLIFYKSFTKVPSLSWSDAVEEALCFGWIDSTKKTIDEERYMQYFSKRKANSHWSKINKEKVAELIEQEQMTEAGFESIARAKENGSWTFLDAIEALVIPEDLKEALAGHKGATDYFEALSKSQKKILLHWVVSAKRAETRQKRIKEIAANAAEHLKPKAFR